MRGMLRIACIATLAIPAAVSGVEHAVSGHVNRMVRFADDGKASEFQQLDSSSSESRIRWRGNGDIGRGMKAGIYIETGVSSSKAGSAPIKADGGDPGDDSAFSIRHSTLWFSGNWGRLWLGHTSQALDNMAETDLSGETLNMYSEAPQDLAGGIAWRTSDGGTISGGNCAAACTVNDTRNNFDGGRSDVLRYDSPAIGPLTVKAAIWNDNAFDVSGQVNTKLGGGDLAITGGWAKREQRDGFDQWAASGSYLFSQGTSITMSFGGRDVTAGPDPMNYWFKLGHKWGNNAVAIGGGWTDDLFVDGAKGWDVGLGFVHTIPRAGVQLYAGYQHQELDLSGGATAALTFSGPSTSTEDINLIYVGSRVQFD